MPDDPLLFVVVELLLLSCSERFKRLLCGCPDLMVKNESSQTCVIQRKVSRLGSGKRDQGD